MGNQILFYFMLKIKLIIIIEKSFFIILTINQIIKIENIKNENHLNIYISFLKIILILFISFLNRISCDVQGGYRLVWSDEFSGNEKFL